MIIETVYGLSVGLMFLGFVLAYKRARKLL